MDVHNECSSLQCLPLVFTMLCPSPVTTAPCKKSSVYATQHTIKRSLLAQDPNIFSSQSSKPSSNNSLTSFSHLSHPTTKFPNTTTTMNSLSDSCPIYRQNVSDCCCAVKNSLSDSCLICRQNFSDCCCAVKNSLSLSISDACPVCKQNVSDCCCAVKNGLGFVLLV
jgi:hypothetical protein